MSARWSKIKIARDGVKTVSEVVKNVRENIPSRRNDLLYAKVFAPLAVGKKIT